MTEEKKLTDEATIDSLKEMAIKFSKDTYVNRVLVNAINLIHRLQDENEEIKSTKHRASWKAKFFKAQAEIERLTEWKDKLQDTKDELEQQLIDTGFKEYCEENKRLTDENAELQKQVDELKKERENVQKILDELGKCGNDKERYAVWVKLIKCCGVEVE